MTERTCGHNKITAGCDVCWVIDLSGQLAESKSNYHAYFLQTEEEIQKLEKELADAVKERDALKVDAQEHSLCSANIYGIIDENVQLREKLKRYGGHLPGCRSLVPHTETATEYCNCGLAEFLK